jgi:hypothetical protein
VRIARVAVSIALLLCNCSLLAQQSPEEQAVWNLEHRYWDYVKALDLVSYRALWHPNFVGWPFVSATPQRKDHITDWIATYSSRGLHLKSFDLKQADSQKTENIVVVHYWLTADWVDKDDHDTMQRSRVTHTWIRSGKGWQIVGGMSSAEAEGEK